MHNVNALTFGSSFFGFGGRDGGPGQPLLGRCRSTSRGLTHPSPTAAHSNPQKPWPKQTLLASVKITVIGVITIALTPPHE